MSTAIRVTVPASTANIGPGFDSFGMALARYDTIEVTASGEPEPVRVEVSGEGAGEVPTDERHLVVRALCAAASQLGIDPAGLVLRCENAIPHARGLGSSAAAIVGGVAAAYALAGRDARDRDDVDGALRLAARLEGHPDNVAASLLGGMVLAWDEGGVTRATRLDVDPRVRPVVFVPSTGCSTRLARGLLPERVPHADAVFQAARAALAVHAMTRDPGLLLAATEDRLHQEYRSEVFPESMRLVRELRARGVAAVISGAGPAVLAVTTTGAVPAGIDTGPFQVHPLPVDVDGVRVE